MMFSMGEIGERLRTQDNRCTAYPIFEVQERKRVYGIDTDYDPKIAWLYDDESVEVHEGHGGISSEALEAKYQEDLNEPRGYRRVGYHEYWEYVQPFFTEVAANRYIQENGHNHAGELRVYAGSAYRNHEWQAVREQLMAKPNVPMNTKACSIIGPGDLDKLMTRYLAGPGLSPDEIEILLFALYAESRASGGVAADAYNKLEARKEIEEGKAGIR